MTSPKKQELYQYIIAVCEQLEIARYLKNEVKNSLQYFHAYKLENIKKNLTSFTNYLLFLNEENCKQIQALEGTKQRKKVNHSLNYFYYHAEMTKSEECKVANKIERNSYQAITLMQGIKGLLLLTIDEFCNASPTRMAINTLIWEQEVGQPKKIKAESRKPKDKS